MSMTEAPETAPETTSDDRAPRRAGPWLSDLGLLVSRRAERLQRTRGTSSTTALLARLRDNVGREPGTDPAIWSVTVDGVSDDARGDDPTQQERAVHAALTLYAVHQQSRDSGAHRPGIGLGQAVTRLERDRGWTTKDQDEGKISPVRRRFNTAVTATSLPELTHHLRGLVTLMRTADVGLDYGLLADDIAQFQRPGGQDVVRRRWGRQLHRLDAAAAHANAPSTNDSTTIENAPTEEDQ
ncbi:type I-E CRISPR-associated protein Cse2/CasB [Oerskovia sp. KBS0722]|uniref:type I-E CRISPR-associated protein Cse2/CasB n=1 Tax=Oerskovia sp. KBS0722 TaxID=1179673 RepID=UPI00110EB18B|nr:type I-E CRISPR-associated protein Cse2/CasB [Oerskovia sp. KBS0722]QDW62025.1 type I-E CRISPR-associated protein Cse2/CasB [Oerskovia sp. KBS0722]